LFKRLVAILFFTIALSTGPLCARPYHILDETLWRLSYLLYIENPASHPGKVELRVTFVPSENPSQEILCREFPSPPVGVEKDGDGNEIGIWKMDMLPAERRLMTFSCKVRTRHIRWDGPTARPPGEPSETRRESAGGVSGEGNSPQTLRDTAQRIAGGEKYPYYRSLVLYDYLLSHYQFDAHEKKYGAAEALEKKIIQCADAALLYKELTRASGIPSRFVGGLYITPGKSDYNELHAWTEVLLPGFSWATVDPTLGRFNSSQRLRCFLERRANYIALWKGDHEPIEIRHGRNEKKSLKGGVTFTLRVEELGGTHAYAMKPEATMRALKVSPGKSWKSAYDLAAYQHYSRGKSLEAEKAPQSAAAEYFAAMKLSPDYLEPVKALLRMDDSGQQREAIREGFEKKVLLCPGDPLAWYGRGELERRLDHYSASSDAFCRAEKNGFRSTDLYLSRISLYSRTKEIRPLENTLKSCLSLDSRNLEAYKKALLFFQDLELWDDCIYWASQGREKIPDSSIFPGIEGFALMGKGDLKKAQSSIEKAIAQEPSMGWYHCIYGWILLKQGDRARAKKEIEQGIALGRGVENPAFYRNLLKATGK
jgi:hypothetical protein